MKLVYNKMALCQFYAQYLMPPSLKNIINHWLFKVLIGVVVVYLLFAYFAVNPIAKKAVPWAAKKYLNSQASVQSAHFNPWRNQLTVDGFVLRNQSDELLAGFEQLFVDFEADGVFERAWKFNTLRLQAPETLLINKSDAQHNWSDLIAKLNESKTKSEPATSLPRLIIQSLAIFEGQFTYQDQRNVDQVTEKLVPIDITLGGFSTLPNQHGEYHLAASLPDGKGNIEWQGDVSVNPLASSGTMTLSELDLPNLLALLDQTAPVKLTQGEVTLSLMYAVNEERPVQVPSDSNQLDSDAVQNVEPTTDIQPSTFALGLNAFKLHANQLAAALPSGVVVRQKQLTLDVPEIKAILGANTDLNVADATVQLDDLTVQARQSDDQPLTLSQVQLEQVAYNLDENRLEIGSLLLDQGMLELVREQSGALDWQAFFAMPDTPEAPAMGSEVSEQVSETATNTSQAVEAMPKAKPLAVVVNDVHLNHWQLHWLDQTFVAPMTVSTPTLNTHFTVTFDDAVRQISKLHINLEDVAMHSGKRTLVKLNKTDVNDGLIDLVKRELTVPVIKSKQLELPVTLWANQSLNWDGVFKQHPISASHKPSPKAESDTAWQWRIGQYQLTDSRIMLTDASQPQPFKYNVEGLSLQVNKLSQALNRSLPVKLGFKLANGGQVKLNGKLAPSPLNANLALTLDQLSIKPFTHYLNQYAALELDNGQLSIQGDIALKKQQKTSIEFNGGLQLTDLSILEEASKTAFLNWDALKGEDISLKLLPNQLSVGTISLVKPVGKFLIAEDKSLNLTKVLRDKKSTTVKAKTTEGATSEQAGFPIRIDKVKVDAAELDFEDLSLRPQFGTHINTLNGVINGLSTDKQTEAKLAFEGKVEEYGSAKIEGALRPFEPTAATDIGLHFKNLAMEKLTPYSGKFAGRKIDSGKLDVDLKYLIEDRQLTGENQIVIKKIKLGEAIDSPDAADLPLDLAIAILQDNQGEIDLDLPVKGDLDDPEFDYSSVVWKAFTGLLTKIVTAPFKVLGKLLGDGDTALDHIAFDVGKAEITPPSAEVLDALAQSLQKRQHLSLAISPTYQLKEDTEAIKALTVHDAVAAQIQEDDADNTLDGPINLSDAATQKAVKALHDKLTEKGLFKRLSDRFDALPPEYYEKAFAELIDAVEVDENTLRTLAASRGEAVIQYLTVQGGDSARMVMKEPKVSTKNETVFAIELGKALAKPLNAENDGQ